MQRKSLLQLAIRQGAKKIIFTACIRQAEASIY